MVGQELSNLLHALDRAATRWPDQLAVCAEHSGLTFAELRAEADRLARRLRSDGVTAGDAVALLLTSAESFARGLHAVLRAGGAAVPLNVTLRPNEVEVLLRSAGVRAVLAEPDLAAALPPSLAELHVPSAKATAGPGGASASSSIVDLSPADLAVIQYTSGTLGEPRGAELTHGAFLAAAAIATELQIGPGDVVFCGAPFFAPPSVFFQLVLPQVGATFVGWPRFVAERAFDLLERTGATHFFGVPTMIEYLLALPAGARRRLPRLRVVCSLGAPASADLIHRAAKTLDVRVINLYGASEVMVVAFGRPDGRDRPGSVGLPAPGARVRIADYSTEARPGVVGEVLVQAPTTMRGYRGRPADTAAKLQDGWLRMGDLGWFDADGYLYLVDRIDSMINRGGYKIAPTEVERVIGEHPAVREVAVVGVADRVKGELIKAVVVPWSADAPPSRAELLEFCRTRLAPYKLPDLIEFRSDLPRTGTGKVGRKSLQAATR